MITFGEYIDTVGGPAMKKALDDIERYKLKHKGRLEYTLKEFAK